MKMPKCVPLSHHCSVIPSYISKAIFAALARGAILCVFILSLCLTPEPARAQLSQLSDENLSGISGQSGVSIVMNGSAQVYFETISFSDTQATPNLIGLHNFSVTGSATGGDFSFATLGADAANPVPGVTVFEPNIIDIATDSDKTYVVMTDSSHMNPRWYKGDLFFYDGSAPQEYALGSIELDELRKGPSVSRLWAHAGGGISFDYTTTISASALIYTYNKTTSEALSLSGIHIAGSANTGVSDPRYPYGHTNTGSGDPDPTTPAWAFSGNFKIGTIGDTCTNCNQPATIDIATNAGVTSLSLNLPMAGTIRVADVIFGTNTDPNLNSNFAKGDPLDFGPIAIDGIQVHRLNVKISGGP